MLKSVKTLALCFMMTALSLPLWSETLSKNQIDSSVNASLDALKTGSISFECSQIRPAHNVTALGQVDLENSQKSGHGGKISTDHDVVLPGKGTLKWNQGKFISSHIEAHINQSDRQTQILQHEFAWDGNRLTSLSSRASSIYNALEETVPDFEKVEGTEKVKGEILDGKGYAMIMFDPIVWVLERSHVAGPDGPILHADSIESQPDSTILVKKGISQIVLDPKQGYLPTRIKHTNPHSDRISEIEVTYKELPGSVWFPIGMVKKQTENGEQILTTEYKVTSYSLDLPESSFVIDFPPGVAVEDRVESTKDVAEN